MKYFHAVRSAKAVGDGTVAALASWLERYVNLLFPDNGIEYWASNQYGRGRGLLRTDLVPTVGTGNGHVHHVACYVRDGTCEGQIIEVSLFLRSEEVKSITWIKTFGSPDESWAIARAITAALDSIITWHEIPELVVMSQKVPCHNPWEHKTSLTDEVTILSGPDKILVATVSGLVLDDRSWQGQVAEFKAAGVAQDWVTILAGMKANFKLVKDVPDRLSVPHLPGYIISKRGVDVAGYYVLPPGGDPNDDRGYLGYFPDADAAIAAAGGHQAQRIPVAA